MSFWSKGSPAKQSAEAITASRKTTIHPTACFLENTIVYNFYQSKNNPQKQKQSAKIKNKDESFMLNQKNAIQTNIYFELNLYYAGRIYIIQLISMTTWLKDQYEGQYKEGWYHGYGKLTMDNGVVYEGQFVKGQFHGDGKLIYPNGGFYKAQWQQGKMISGEYIFNDNLIFEKDNWKHCINDDRRFYQEYLHGIKPSGATQQTREDKPYNIPTGTYDTGDGYYEPVKSIIYTYDGKILRTPSEQQVKFILAKCRYVAKAIDIDGSKDRVIKKVVQIQKKK